MLNKIKPSTVQYICNHSIIYLSDMTHFVHSNLNKSKPGRKLIRLTPQHDISAQEKTFWNHQCDIWMWWEKATWAHQTKTVNDKVFPLQFTSNYHWADYKLPMETVYNLYV